MGGEYEIRILDQPGAARMSLVEYHLTDQAAIRSARKEAEGKPFEVWRDDKRIYPSE
jgi:hypothetical protein